MIILGTRKPYNFDNFKLVVDRNRKDKRVPYNSRIGYSRWSRDRDPVAHDFSLEEIEQIICSGDLASLRELSRYFYRTNSNYRNNIDFLANLPLYDNVVIPIFQEDKGSKTQIIKAFYNACNFIDNMDLPNNLARITKEWMKTGIYNGILQIDGDKAVIQDLPLEYCRTRFKDFNNLNILEFNLVYFSHIVDEALREEAVLTFPKEIQEAWKLYKDHLISDPWVPLPAGAGGICFTFVGDSTPPLIASIPELKKLNDVVPDDLKTPYWLIIVVIGIVTILVGIVCMIKPIVTAMSVGTLIGIAIVISGCENMAISFYGSHKVN